MSGERPAVTFSTSSTSRPSKSTTLDCGEGVVLKETPTSFFIAIPVQEYAKGYRFDIRTDRAGAKDVVLTAKSGGVTPAANTIVRTPVKTLIAADYKKIIPDKAFRDAQVQQSFVTVTDETTGEVEIVKTTGSISVVGKSVGSLAGIEYFPGITSLICPNNQLTKLDVSHTRNQMTTLEVSANTLLETIYCNYNRLTKLDATNRANPESFLLYCGKQQDAAGQSIT